MTLLMTNSPTCVLLAVGLVPSSTNYDQMLATVRFPMAVPHFGKLSGTTRN